MNFYIGFENGSGVLSLSNWLHRNSGRKQQRRIWHYNWYKHSL